ncbi:hypothetical protein [Paracoccus sphaerophysae]|uniref:Uncharacterized protein n=1 Tax=Paracoccus sphaerophysae TaxID=690417 RepID=A0A099FG90_9RHOB|nr:hypothetical protein [Paracoccus sphaerophysae]KGJ09266.1 hypothetical protein IC63_02090 [Paracoccus sphaerophysae]
MPSCSQTGTPRHFQDFPDIGQGGVDQLAHPARHLAAPFVQLGDTDVDACGGIGSGHGETSLLRLAAALRG